MTITPVILHIEEEVTQSELALTVRGRMCSRQAGSEFMVVAASLRNPPSPDLLLLSRHSVNRKDSFILTGQFSHVGTKALNTAHLVDYIPHPLPCSAALVVLAIPLPYLLSMSERWMPWNQRKVCQGSCSARDELHTVSNPHR